METKVLVVERLFRSDIKDVWRAITEKDLMKQWYFDLAEFKAEVGFTFEFYGEDTESNQYLHLCEVIEVIPEQKLTYSWKYDGYEGISYVTFEIEVVGENTKLTLTHRGLESFPQNNKAFLYHNFEEGWNEIIYTSLKTFLEK
jgi:uncharacterized protein YndB with AHSA1/START domain